MIRLTAGQTLELILGGNVATNQLAVTTCFMDVGVSYVGDCQQAVSNNATAVTICAAPAAGAQWRDIDYVNIYNADTVPAVVIVRKNTGAATYVQRDVVLQPDDTLSYTHAAGWVVTTHNASMENTANKDASGGYAGLTLFKINFKNALNTFTSFFTNSNTAARTYTFQDRDGTIADNTDLAGKAALAGSASQAFSAAAATAAAHAVRADQIQGASLTAFTTGGTGTAFTLTPTPAITAYAANQTFDVVFNVACGASPTLAISGIASPPNLVRQNTDGTYTNLTTNSFPAGWQSPVKLVSATQALVLRLPPRVFTGSFSRDLSLAGGSVSTTGIGFKPRKVTFFSVVNGVANVVSHGTAAQLSAGIGHAGNYVNYAGLADTMTSYAIFHYPSLSNYQAAGVSSFDADGFTLTWVKTGTPTGTSYTSYIAEE